MAPDQRGYGRTTGWDDRFNGDLQSFTISRIAIDAFALVRALGMKAVHTVVGHDFGSPIAAWCGLTRPDVFRSCVMMSAPYRPAPPVGSSRLGTPKFVGGLAELERPRKHYVWYYSTPEANDDMRNCPQGIRDFLRAYFHVKSGEWSGNRPFPLQAMTADELAKLPTYYVMDRDADMAATVAPFMPSSEQVASCQWMRKAISISMRPNSAARVFKAGLTGIDAGPFPALPWKWSYSTVEGLYVPLMFIGGERDWGIHQTAGALNAMETSCSDYRGTVLVPGGHCVQQEAPEPDHAALSRTGWSFWTRPERPPRWRACEAAARRGQGCFRKVPFGHWKTQTFIAGLRCDALTAPFVIDAPMDRRIFETYVETELAPTLKPGDVVVLDDLPAHEAPAPRAGRSRHRRFVLFLPLSLRPDADQDGLGEVRGPSLSQAVRTIDALWRAIGEICDLFSPHRVPKLLPRRRLRLT